MTQLDPRTEARSAPVAQTDGDVRAALTFIVPQDTKPYFESAALTGGVPKVHFRTEDRAVAIRDMRPMRDTLSLDRQGFELHRHDTTVDNFYDNDAVDELYRRELETLLKEITGADRVVVFDYTRRSDGPSGAAHRQRSRTPANRVHVDYTVTSGPKRARDVLGAEVFERIVSKGGRIVQVNAWRPIKGPVQRAPLALGDAQSLKSDELIATDQIFPDRVGEIYHVACGPQQRWYWAPRMQRDEVILIKGWDSLDDGRARFTPHGAFKLPSETVDTPARESIEARTYLIFDA